MHRGSGIRRGWYACIKGNTGVQKPLGGRVEWPKEAVFYAALVVLGAFLLIRGIRRLVQ